MPAMVSEAFRADVAQQRIEHDKLAAALPALCDVPEDFRMCALRDYVSRQEALLLEAEKMIAEADADSGADLKSGRATTL
jgi:hypothetical protein